MLVPIDSRFRKRSKCKSLRMTTEDNDVDDGRQMMVLATGRDRGSQLYFHITRYVLKRRREDTFWGVKSESRVSTPFFTSKTV